MKIKSVTLLGMMASLLLISLAACNLPNPIAATPTQTVELAQIVAGTQTALAGNLQSATASPQLTLTSTETKIPTTPAPSPTTSAPTETQQPDCTDSAKFSGETIPDESVFRPGDVFTKTWQLQNNGSCTWNNGYALIFSSGDQMEGTSPSQLIGNTPPKATAVVSARLTAPETQGLYQGNWQLRNSAGTPYGIGVNGDQPFWVRINVSEAGQEQDLGTPDWQDSFEADLKRWYLPADGQMMMEIKDESLLVTALSSSGDSWRVAELPALTDFYIEMEVTTGAECMKKDSYGFILRAPDNPDNVVDSGYVFGFSCDGNYRYYRMDDGEYVGLKNWTASPFLTQGPDQSNRVGVRAEGDTFQISINGNLVEEFTDSTSSKGLFGVMIRSAGTPNFQVFVEEMAYWNLP